MLTFSKETTHLLEHAQILLLQLTVHLYYNRNVKGSCLWVQRWHYRIYFFEGRSSGYSCLSLSANIFKGSWLHEHHFGLRYMLSCLLVNAMDGALHEYPEISWYINSGLCILSDCCVERCCRIWVQPDKFTDVYSVFSTTVQPSLLLTLCVQH